MNKEESKNLTDEERNEGRLIPPPRAEIRRSPLLRGVCEALSRLLKQLGLFLTNREGERNRRRNTDVHIPLLVAWLESM